MRLIQHKKEAFWFYRFLSIIYDHYVNPFFWTEMMRDKALSLAKIEHPNLMTLDVGSGTGFTTLGIVEKINAENVFCIDQSPHQMAKAKQKTKLQNCHFQLGDAENLPFSTNCFDRYVSAGSIEYWPDPQQAIQEAFRVIKPGGIALIIGPLKPQNPIARFIAETWMLFPEESEYVSWFREAGFTNIKKIHIAPQWVQKERYGIAVSGVKSTSKEAVVRDSMGKTEINITSSSKLLIFLRVTIGSLVAFLFIPYAIFASTKAQLPKRQNGKNVVAFTKQQKTAMLIFGFAFLIIILWFLL
jgi:MPBQ/MSBQ methyltransferase